MKLNTRNLSMAAALAAFAIAGSANAQLVRFYLAYGDAATAALNGAAVGDEAGGTIKVNPGAHNFTMQYFAEILGGVGNLTGGSMFVGVDEAMASTTNLTKAQLDAAGSSTALTFQGATAAASLTNLGTVDPGAVSIIGSGFSGTFGAGTTLRSIGLQASYGFGVGNNPPIEIGAKIRLADVLLSSNMVAGDIFGDGAGENGLTLNHVANSSSRSNFFTANGQQTSLRPGGTTKYNVQAVPEPGTMVAIAAGLAALAARRRRS